MAIFKTGDVVQLKSGGPLMTVKRCIGDDSDHTMTTSLDEKYLVEGFHNGDVICQWFENRTPKEGVFPAASVNRVNTQTDF